MNIELQDGKSTCNGRCEATYSSNPRPACQSEKQLLLYLIVLKDKKGILFLQTKWHVTIDADLPLTFWKDTFLYKFILLLR